MNGEVSQPGQVIEGQPDKVDVKPAIESNTLYDTIVAALCDSVTAPVWFKHIISCLGKSRVLGSGGFATVYQVDISHLLHAIPSHANNKSIKHVACKKLAMNAVNDSIRKQFNSEVASMQRMNHEHVVRVLGSACSKDNSMIIMELMGGGSIYDAVTDDRADPPSVEGVAKPAKLTYQQRFKWIKQLLLGVEALHDAKIAHRDLKAANLLLNNDRTLLKIGDFGLAKIKDETMTVAGHKGEASIAVGTRRHMAPELFDPKVRKPDLFAADIYAVGGCIEHILTGEIPHAHLREDVLFDFARRHPEDLVDAELPADCPNRGKWESLIGACRSVRPTQRPTIAHAIKTTTELMDMNASDSVHVTDQLFIEQMQRLVLNESVQKQRAEQANSEAARKERQRLVDLAAQLVDAKQRLEDERIAQEKARLDLQRRVQALALQQEQERQRQAITRARERAQQAELARLEQEQQTRLAQAAQAEKEARRAHEAALAHQSQRHALSMQSFAAAQSPSYVYATPPRAAAAHSGVATGERYRSNGSADGREIYRGPKGGLYTITPSGNKSYIRG